MNVRNWKHRRFLVICTGLLVVDVFIVACSSSKPASSSTTASSSTPPKYWADLTPIVTVKDLMHDMIDPIADNVFEAVKIIVDKNGTIETKPRTEEDWDRVKVGATMLAEGAELLLVPRPFAPAGDENNSIGPEPPELSPAQITAKVQKDPVAWLAKVQALRNVGLEVLDLIKKKDAAGLWDAGENLDEACENCHIEYWYPGDKALLEKLDRRLEELYGPRANRIPLGMPKK